MRSEQISIRLDKVVVLHASDKMQWNVLLRFRRGNLETAHNLKVPLTQSGRRFFLFLCHSRVVRCDFIES